jgi:ribosomal protein S27E
MKKADKISQIACAKCAEKSLAFVRTKTKIVEEYSVTYHTCKCQKCEAVQRIYSRTQYSFAVIDGAVKWRTE